MLKFNRVAWIFSINSFAAALLALLVGYWLDLPRPYWAMMTVYVISQPLAGAVRSKAIYRVCGTLLGAVFAVFITPPLVNAPPLLSVAIAAWVGFCLFISLLDRTPRAYVVMLAGYTAALIAFPTVDHPDQIFDIAVARVEEILLGIACATLTHSLFFPRPVGTLLRQRLISWLQEGDAWALDLLRGGPAARTGTDRRHLAAAASEIHMLTVLLPFDTSALHDTGAVVRTLNERMTLLIPILSGVADRLAALQGHAGLAQRELDAMADWITGGCDAGPVPALAALLANARAALVGRDWATLLRESLLSRLQDLLSTLGESHMLLVYLSRPGDRLPPDLAQAVATQTSRPLHRDIGMAAVSGLAASLSMLVVCTLWIATSWPEGGIAAALAGVFCAIHSGLDDPAPAVAKFGLFTALALPVAAIYQFGILPAIDGFPMLALVLAPTLLLSGAAMTDRRTAGPATFFTLALVAALALQENFSANFAAFVNTNAAQFVAFVVVVLVTRGMRSMSVDVAARRLLVRNWSSLASLAQREHDPDMIELASQLVDRLGLVTPKLAAADMTDQTDAVDALTDLRIAMNIAVLQRQRASFTPALAAAASGVLRQVGGYFADRATGRVTRPSDDLLRALDGLLDRIARAAQPGKRGGVTALVGLRRNLFPNAAPFTPQTVEQIFQ